MKHTLHQAQLSSGVRLLIIDVPNSNTFSFNTVVRAGFKYADQAKFELPHLLEHLAFDGTTAYPTPSDFAFALEGEGTSSNAYTSSDIIRYYYNGGRTDLDNIVDLACEQLAESTFEADAIEAEKGVVESELSRLLENDGHMNWFESMKHLEPKSGLAYSERISQLAGISRDDIVKFYQQTHVGNNTCIVLAGDFNRGRGVDKLVAQLEAKLKNLPKGKERPYAKHRLPANYGRKLILTNSLKKSEGYFDLTFVNSEYTHDLGQRAAMRLFNTILCGGSASRLYLSTRLKGLGYGPQSFYNFDADFSVAGVEDRATPAKLEALLTECVEQTFAIVRGDYSEAELNRARGYERGGFQVGFERPSDLAGWYGSDFVWRREMNSPDEMVVELAKATRENIAAIASKFYRADNWVLSVRAPEGSVDEAKYRAILESVAKG